ncbi:MAG: hypothetical protein ACP5VP_08240 [Candidatus Limnocylindrales bacterium]
MYFYEIHESDDDLYADALLTHEQEFTPEEFFELVQEARRRVQDTFEEESLVEAIALELARSEGFVYVNDALLVAAVNVSRIEDDNFLAAIDQADGSDEDEDEDEEADDGEDEEDEDAFGFRTLIVDVDRERPN